MRRVGIISGVFSVLLYIDREKRFIIFILSQQLQGVARFGLGLVSNGGMRSCKGWIGFDFGWWVVRLGGRVVGFCHDLGWGSL